MSASLRGLEEGVFHIDVEVAQQGVRNQCVVPGRKVVLLCISVRRSRVEQIFNSKQHGQFGGRLVNFRSLPTIDSQAVSQRLHDA
jgi:hypothetical protein